MVPYALVVEGLGPISAIKAGIGLFLKNKIDVFLIWLVVMAIWVTIQFLGVPFSGSEYRQHHLLILERSRRPSRDIAPIHRLVDEALHDESGEDTRRPKRSFRTKR